MSSQDDVARVFTEHRPRLLGVAYRLTSSWADAEDVVSRTWPRWQEHASEVRNPAAWLTTVVSRLALDELRSARARREHYVGPWLPEPLVHALDSHHPVAGLPATDPAEAVVLDESVRMAFLVVLDTLSPEQRVAVVLHDVLDMPFDEVAEVIGCPVATARQHASRGRRRLSGAAPPRTASAPEALAVLAELANALQSGDADRVGELLADDVTFVTDSDGRVSAARRPLVGADEVSRFLLGLARRADDPATTLEPVLVNGAPGYLMRSGSTRPQDPKVGVYAVVLDGGQVSAVHAVLAPDKVGRYARPPHGSSPDPQP